MYWQIAKYGIPAALAVAFVLHYTGLRSERAELRQTVTEMSQDIAGLKGQALEDAGRITALAASRDELDRLYQDQQAQSQRELQRVQTGMRNLRHALENLKTQPALDGTLGPDVTALLYEQRDAAAADLTARAKRLGSSGSGDLQAGPAPDDGTGTATGEPRDIAGPERTDADTSSGVDGGEPELGQARLGLDDGLAGSVAGTGGVLNASERVGPRTNGQILQQMFEARLAEVGFYKLPEQGSGDVTVASLTCAQEAVLDRVVKAEQPDGSIAETTVARSPRVFHGTATVIGGTILTADHVIEEGCDLILIDNRVYKASIQRLPDLDVALLGGEPLTACAGYREGAAVNTKAVRKVATLGASEFALFNLMQDAGETIPVPAYGRSDQVPAVSQPIKLRAAPVHGNSGGALLYEDGTFAGIITASTPDEGLGWFTPVSEICKAMAEQ